ncbi:NACHT domain-containing protein [Microbulbifer spongiae]|uniref:ATP-binding protein n=1 Tax=Microbulbifer spongiae TaxID=2944933 RepID=A0ABY9E826_9GAMM|nr:ATP-binding protein [Microbulbifer sp. MI-G]WKD49170.1 ATP-binding protein [Microbulbifer sp. MI-G]
MLLIFRELSFDESRQGKVEITFTSSTTQIHFITEKTFVSPFYPLIKQQLRWYFNQYPFELDQQEKAAWVFNKLLQLGQLLAEKLDNDNCDLKKIANAVETTGYHQLQVFIVSSSPMFMAEFWESLILPDSKFVLAAACAGFCRVLTEEFDPQLVYPLELALQPASKPGVQDILQDQKHQIRWDPHSGDTLNIAVFTSLFSTSEDFSQLLTGMIKTKLRADPIEYHLLGKSQAAALTLPENCHIFHFSGQIIKQCGTYLLVLEGEADNPLKTLGFTELCQDLQAHKVHLLSLSSRITTEEVAQLAGIAHTFEISNVLWLQYPLNSAVSFTTYAEIYRQLTLGRTISQAVVEARKSLQNPKTETLLPALATGYHPWLLPALFTVKDVRFFMSQTVVNSETEKYLQEMLLGQLHARLAGFKSELLPETFYPLSDGIAADVLTSFGEHRMVCLSGSQGIGKTTLVHQLAAWLAVHKQIDWGFYFDFAQENYSLNDMLQMVRPLIAKNEEDLATVQVKWLATTSLLVLDNADSLIDTDSGDMADAGIWQWLQALQESRHKVVIILKSAELTHHFVYNQKQPHFILKGFSVPEQHQFIYSRAQQLQQPYLFEKILGQPWLAALSSNPLLLETCLKVTPLHSDQTLNKVLNPPRVSYQKIISWQWNNIEPAWQKLLLLSSKTPNLLLEMLMIALQQPPDQAIADIAAFKDQIGMETTENISEEIRQAELRGFVNRLPHGHVIAERAKIHLEKIAKQRLESTDQFALISAFSSIVCEGLRILCGGMVKQANPYIENNLLFNRRNWAEHLEKIWEEQRYQLFFATLEPLHELLSKHKLQYELTAWTFKIIEQFVPHADAEMEVTQQLAGLKLLNYALTHQKTTETLPVFLGKLIEYWQQWFVQIDGELDQNQILLFQLVVCCLEAFYLHTKDTDKGIALCEKTAAIYLAREAWQPLIRCYKSLSLFHLQNHHPQLAREFEDKILYKIPYDHAPPGFQQRQRLDILISRLDRNELADAQEILNQLKYNSDKTFVDNTDLLKGLQSEIFFLKRDFFSALPLLAREWNTLLTLNQPQLIQSLKEKLLVIATEIGEEQFKKIFFRHVSEDTKLPMDF